jgi:hypothetical protein
MEEFDPDPLYGSAEQMGLPWRESFSPEPVD